MARDWPDRMIFSHQNGRVSVRNRRYRLDDRGALYDMGADPGQTRNIAAAEPQVAAMLARAVADWRQDVLGEAHARAAAAAAAAAGAPRKPPQRMHRDDDRPFPVGYRQFPQTILPARDGVPHGTVKRSAGAPNCSYFVNWTSLDDTMTWDVEVNTTGQYEVSIDYTCRPADVGSLVELNFNGAAVRARVQPAWDPPLYTNQDTIPRPRGESQMKPFRPLKLGTVRLEKGRGLLALRALEIPGTGVMDVRHISLTLIEQ